MNKKGREALDAYYAEGESWAKDRRERDRASRKLAWIVALAAATVAVLEAIALIVLMPLKTVEPHTILVDRTTGFVQEVSPLEPQRLTGDAALTQSFLVQYVIARESFDINALQTNYRKVGLWSADAARSSYTSGMQASNPDSPLNLYPRSSVVETRVKSVSPSPDGGVMVRFETQRRDAGGQAEPPRPWVSIIRYRFSTDAMSAEDRFVNPLGFQVVHYRRDPEALPPEPDPADALSVTPPSSVVTAARPALSAAVQPRAPAPARRPEPVLVDPVL